MCTKRNLVHVFLAHPDSMVHRLQVQFRENCILVELIKKLVNNWNAELIRYRDYLKLRNQCKNASCSFFLTNKIGLEKRVYTRLDDFDS